eukprot:4422583-Ditylum_brightwellii.AAC.1
MDACIACNPSHTDTREVKIDKPPPPNPMTLIVQGLRPPLGMTTPPVSDIDSAVPSELMLLLVLQRPANVMPGRGFRSIMRADLNILSFPLLDAATAINDHCNMHLAEGQREEMSQSS